MPLASADGRVAVDGFDGAGGRGLVELAGAEHVRPADHRVQGRAQLVREGGEELVLGPAGRFRVQQQPLALVLGPAPVRDVDGGAHVGHERPVFRVMRHPRVVHPAVLAVEAAQPILQLVRAAAVDRPQVGAQAALEIVGVDPLRPAVLPLGRERAPGEGQPLAIEMGAGAVGPGGPETDGSVIEQLGGARGRFHQAFPQRTTGLGGGQGPRVR